MSVPVYLLPTLVSREYLPSSVKIISVTVPLPGILSSLMSCGLGKLRTTLFILYTRGHCRGEQPQTSSWLAQAPSSTDQFEM